MKTIIKFEADTKGKLAAQEYQTEQCFSYDVGRIEGVAQNIIELMRSKPELLNTLGSITESYDWLVNLLIQSEILNVTPVNIMQKYGKLGRDSRNKLILLQDRLKSTDIISLTPAEQELLEKSLLLFLNPNATTRPIQVNSKASKLDALFTVNNIGLNAFHRLLLPCDWTIIVQAAELIFQMKNQYQEIEQLGIAVKQAYSTQLIHMIQEDFSHDKLGELCIVKPEWQTDTEVSTGIMIRDKAHIKHNGFILLLTTEELSLLNDEHFKTLDLHPIYKISTIMHSTDFTSDLCAQIHELVTNCCGGSDSPYPLREIVLRQCSSAGSRVMLDDKQENIARVTEAQSQLPDIADIAAQKTAMLTRFRDNPLAVSAKEFTATWKEKLYELRTRDSHGLEGEQFISKDENGAVFMLARELQKDATLREKLPDLLVKGYYGPISPYPARDPDAVMFPSTEKAAHGLTLPERFYKATRVAVFKNADDLMPTHYSRKDI